MANENLFAFGGVFFKVAKCYNLKAPRFSLGGAGAYYHRSSKFVMYEHPRLDRVLVLGMRFLCKIRIFRMVLGVICYN